MNPKQSVPLLVTLAPLAAVMPPIIIGGIIAGSILVVLDALLSKEDEKKPETLPVEANAESARKEAETTVFRQIPTEIHAKPAPVPAPSVLGVAVPPLPAQAPMAIPSVVKALRPGPAPQTVTAPQRPPQPQAIKKSVTREDVATIFEHGTRTLDRTAAVAALKRLGFGKTAAYAALSPDGRFVPWLQCAPDGTITWTDGHRT